MQKKNGMSSNLPDRQSRSSDFSLPLRSSFFQEVFKSDALTAIEDYKDLKENMTNVEFSLSKPKVSYQYAEIRVRSKR